MKKEFQLLAYCTLTLMLLIMTVVNVDAARPKRPRPIKVRGSSIGSYPPTRSPQAEIVTCTVDFESYVAELSFNMNIGEVVIEVVDQFGDVFNTTIVNTEFEDIVIIDIPTIAEGESCTINLTSDLYIGYAEVE